MTEIEREELFKRNNKIIEIVVDAIRKYCPLEVDLIGIGGSFCTGDFYEKSDLDLVIIGSNEAAKVLNKCFILNNVGFDVYVQDWSRFVSMAEYNSPYVTKLIDLDIKYVKNDNVKDRYLELSNRLKENMNDTDSIKAKIGMKYEVCRSYYKKLINSNDKSDILMNYGMLIRTVEFIIYMINKEYVKGSTRNIPDEINKLSIMPSNFLKAYNSILDFDNMEHIKIIAFGLISSLEAYIRYSNISFKEDYELPENEIKKDVITSDLLTGTYEEIYSNWYNKMKYAVSNNHKYLSFATMVSCQEFYNEMADSYDIPRIDLIGNYDNDNLQNNVIAFEKAMNEWKKLYDMFNKSVVSYNDLDGLSCLYGL